MLRWCLVIDPELLSELVDRDLLEVPVFVGGTKIIIVQPKFKRPFDLAVQVEANQRLECTTSSAYSGNGPRCLREMLLWPMCLLQVL